MQATSMWATQFRFLSVLAAMHAVALILFAAKPEDFGTKDIEGIWKEGWKSDDPKIKEPKIEKLSEQRVIEHMTGKWAAKFGVGPEKLLISLSTNHLVEVSGQREGATWKRSGQWRVISDKLVLFLKEDDIPSFIFLTGRRTFIFDPWAGMMKSELKR